MVIGGVIIIAAVLIGIVFKFAIYDYFRAAISP